MNPSCEPNIEITVSQHGPHGDLHKQQRRTWKNEKNVGSHSNTIPSRKNAKRQHISVGTEKNVDGDYGSSLCCNDSDVQTIGSLSGDERKSMLSGDGRCVFTNLRTSKNMCSSFAGVLLLVQSASRSDSIVHFYMLSVLRTESILPSRQRDYKNASIFTVATPPRTQRHRRPSSLLEEVQGRKRVIMGGKEQSKRTSTMSQEEAINPTEADYRNQDRRDEFKTSQKIETTLDIPHMELTDDTCSLVAKYFTYSSSSAILNMVSSTTLAETTIAGKLFKNDGMMNLKSSSSFTICTF